MSEHVLTLNRLLGRLNIAENLSWPERYALDAAILALSNAAGQEAEFPECSGDPTDCPENEGHGC